MIRFRFVTFLLNGAKSTPIFPLAKSGFTLVSHASVTKDS
jgi:hypothetical protein